MAETFKKIAGIETQHIILKSLIYSLESIELDKKYNHIGVFTHNQYRKNIDNQIAAALMLENAKVHTRKNYNYQYFLNTSNIEYHSYFENYSDFMQLLGSMTVNLYVSFSECWGQVITESLSMGVPCLAANNSGIFDDNKILYDLLVVEEFDNSHAIYNKIKTILNIGDDLKQEMKNYVLYLNNKADANLKEFLNA